MEKWYQEALEIKSWGNLVDKAANKYGSRPFLISEGKRVSFEEFRQQVDTVAKGLLQLGVRKDEVIGIWMTNCLEWPVLQYAIYKVGAVMTPIYTYFRQPEVEWVLQQADVSRLFMKDSFLGGKVDALGMLRSMCPEVDQLDAVSFRSARFPRLKTIVALDGERLKGRLDYRRTIEMGDARHASARLRQAQAAVEPFDVCNIMFTSGTTGRPKGGLSMHLNNLCCWSLSAQRFDYGVNTRLLHFYPIFTNAGIFFVAFGLLTGCSVVLMGERHTDPGYALELIEKEKITDVPGMITHYVGMLSDPQFHKRDLSSWKGGVCAGQYTVPVILEEARKRGWKLMNVYGLSETGGSNTQTFTFDAVEQTLGSIGTPLPSVRLKIVDSQTGKRVAPGQDGEAWLHDVYPGSCLGKGYYNMPDKTREAITDDGWFRTGDLLREDENGYLHFIGRSKDMLKVGGFNVYEAEVELALTGHPGIAEAYVVGVQDPRLVEVPVAWVSVREGTKLTEDEVISYAKSQLSSYKVPKAVHFFKPGELPLTGSGKVQKFKLRDLANKMSGAKNP